MELFDESRVWFLILFLGRTVTQDQLLKTQAGDIFQQEFLI